MSPRENFSSDTLLHLSSPMGIDEIPNRIEAIPQDKPEVLHPKKRFHQLNVITPTKRFSSPKVQEKLIDHNHKRKPAKNQTLLLILVIFFLILILAVFALMTYYAGTLIFSLNTYLIWQSLLFLVAVWINVFIALYLLHFWKKLLPK